MAENTRQIQFDIVVEGADSGASEVTRLNRAFDATARSTGSAVSGLSRVSSTVTEGGRRWGELAGAVGNVGSVFAQVSPVMGQAGSVIGAVGTASTALTGALGPLGVGFAAVTTALGLIIPLLQSTSDEMRNVARESDNANQSTQDLIRSLREARRERNIEGFSASGAALGESVEDIEGQIAERTAYEERYQQGINQLREQYANLERERQRSLDVERLSAIREEQALTERAIDQLTEVQRRSEAQRAQLRETQDQRLMRALQQDVDDRIAAEEEAEERANDRRRAAARDGAKTREDAEREATQAILEALRHEYEERERMARAHTRMLRAELNEREADFRQRMSQVDEDIREEGRIMDEELRVDHENKLRQTEERRKAEEEAMQSLKDDSLPIIQEVVGGMTDALSSVIAGAKSADEAFQGLLAGFLELIAQQTALQAAKEFAEAIAAAASQSYDKMGLHLAAGAAFTAVAVAAGAASIAVAPPAEAAPASPQSSGASGGGGGNSYTFNVNGPVLTAGSRANLGRELSSVLSDGERRFGRAA